MASPVRVAVPLPAHSALGGPLSYASESPLAPGTLVRVPLGSRECLGVVWPDTPGTDEAPPAAAVKPVSQVLAGVPPLGATWLKLVGFAAHYYQRSVGEIAQSALPQALRDLDAVQLARRLARQAKQAAAAAHAAGATDTPESMAPTPEQALTLAEIAAEMGPFLLFGATGSGKTEVYLRAVAEVLARDPQAQALVLVPEINLTPQLEARVTARFGAGAVVSLHSGLTHPQRLQHWLAAHTGRARIVLGTRLAVFASLPRLRLIVVDEEHDPSYKQQEGARYSARDLAVLRGRLESEAAGDPCKVILGSATPSLESWHLSRPAEDGGRYRRLVMPSRVGQAVLPKVRRIDMRLQPRGTRLAPVLLDAVAQTVARGDQALLFLNRRGYAPVLACTDCDWKSDCPHCSAFQVFHKIDRTLRCHHCGTAARVPRACPTCGNPDIRPLGEGTEQLEERVAELLADLARPDGTPLRVMRMDADTTRGKGELADRLAQVHDGAVDVLVGTQMVAKGHDFRRIGLVAAVNPDGALFSSDFRAPERLFSLLMQAAGRAGRDGTRGTPAEMWLQTGQPDHPVYEALRRHDYAAFASQQLTERRQAGLPPFSFQALVRADARTQEAAQAFLNAASAAAESLSEAVGVTRYPAVPLTLQRVAGVERAQLLLESPSRPALQRFLRAWQPLLHAQRPESRGLLRWAVDVDPLAI